MSKFKFICESKISHFSSATHLVSHEVDAETLTEVIEYFENFLRGCGYVLDGRHLEIVEEESFDSKAEDDEDF